MRYRTDFKQGDRVYYQTRTGKSEKIAAVIEEVHEDAQSNAEFAEYYRIAITTNKCSTYRKGETFTTSGNFLLRRSGKPKTESQPRPTKDHPRHTKS